MSPKDHALNAMWAAAVIGLLVGVDMTLPLPGPSPELDQWTEWAGKVVGILVAARVLFAGAQYVEAKARKVAAG